MKKLIIMLITLTACFGDNIVPPPAPDGPRKPTCMNRRPDLDARCIAMFESGRVRYGFICDDGTEIPLGPEHPPKCWLFEALSDENGHVYNPGKMCCTSTDPRGENNVE